MSIPETSGPVVTYAAELAWLPTGVHRRVRLTVESGRFVAIEPDAAAHPEDVRLPGLVLPGLANTHSHAFHRALRGRTHAGGGTFWTWREAMYAVAQRLDPDSYLALARATYAEMALAGITCVGEFHYLHHAVGGQPYADPNAMGLALVRAAREAGIRLTLLDACYLSGGLGPDGPLPLAGPQLRFGDGDVEGWAARIARLPLEANTVHGCAIHSVRAVARDDIATVVAATGDRPLHFHLSEQPIENQQCLAAYGVSPTRVLADAGALGPLSTAVHATHLSAADINTLAATGTTISFCPSTERDLADGMGPARALFDAGCPVTLGSDQNAVIDLFEEARGLELHERLATLHRGRFSPGELFEAATGAGHRSLGWPDAGVLAVGARADLVAVRLDSVRTAGIDPTQLVMVASAADVDTVIVDGEVIVTHGRHRLGDVAAALAAAIQPLWAVPQPFPSSDLAGLGMLER
jgi:formiminoglutamate deiminase